MQRQAIAAGLAALCSGSCALAPQYESFYLGHEDWRGTALSPRGRVVVSDIVAGAKPYSIALVEIGGVLGLPSDPARRIPILDRRAQNAIAELERDGIPPDLISVEVFPIAEGIDREPAGVFSRSLVVVIRYY
jgi:hypothetical protein